MVGIGEVEAGATNTLRLSMHVARTLRRSGLAVSSFSMPDLHLANV